MAKFAKVFTVDTAGFERAMADAAAFLNSGILDRDSEIEIVVRGEIPGLERVRTRTVTKRKPRAPRSGVPSAFTPDDVEVIP